MSRIEIGAKLSKFFEKAINFTPLKQPIQQLCEIIEEADCSLENYLSDRQSKLDLKVE
jgi:hypothetical protein